MRLTEAESHIKEAIAKVYRRKDHCRKTIDNAQKYADAGNNTVIDQALEGIAFLRRLEHNIRAEFEIPDSYFHVPSDMVIAAIGRHESQPSEDGQDWAKRIRAEHGLPDSANYPD